MTQRVTRRNFLRAGSTTALAATAGCMGLKSVPTLLTEQVDRWDLTRVEIRGANYIPARAYNAYQMWRDYDPAVIERDLSYAASLNLNAVRIFLSFEFWQEDSDAHADAIEHLLQTAAEKGMRVLPALFDTVGLPPTEANLTDQNPLKASGVFSPSAGLIANRELWNRARSFVTWFMDHHRNNPRLLAIDLMNEPAVQASIEEVDRVNFAQVLFRTMADHRGKVPLTIGTVLLQNTRFFIDLGVDVFQFHWNFPPSVDSMRHFLRKAVSTKQIMHQPVWLSEWQRTRPGGTGWQDEPLEADEWYPNYFSLVQPVRASRIDGDFFWSLMLKPAYLLPQRQKATLTGVFHEDGAVWSLEDARALARDSEFDAPERRTWPEWAETIPRHYREDE